ncbi:MAG: T9SS type A sorting domain-containing protein [Bacteroidetes bacterium]|nr:T9SS type A sorting domain-containing protein [Bacteroidota bacterium]
MKKNIFFSLMVLLLLNLNFSSAATYYTRVTGNWNALTTWSTVGCGGAMAATFPAAGDNIIVCVGTTVTVNINTTIANVTINSGGTLQNGGGSTTNRSLTVTGTLNVANGGTLIQNSTVVASSSLFAGTEIFGISSTVTISNWSSIAVPLINGVGTNFGHLNLNWNPGVNWWNNQGLGTTRTINGYLTVGTNCQTFLDSSSSNISITIGSNLTVNGKLQVKKSMPGTATLLVNGNGSIGAAGIFTGVFNGTGHFTFSITNLTTNAGGTFNGILDGIGNATITINGVFISAGDFYGINAPLLLNNGVPAITMNSLSYTRGTFMASYAHNVNGTAVVNILGNATVAFTVATDNIKLLGLSNINGNNVTTKLNFTVGGNLSISGLSTCVFNTSEAFGAETISVGGTFTVTDAKAMFNGGLNESSGHKVTATMGGFTISGGTVWFSENSSDSTNITVNGNLLLSGGTFILKSAGGYANLIINGSFTQNFVGSLYYMHGPDQLGAATLSNSFVDMHVNGSFTQTGGVLHFDIADSPAEQRIFVNGPAYTISNSAAMYRAGSGTSTSFAKIIFEYPGTITYFRNLAHNIQQCKQTIKTGCTVNVTSGPFQMSSHNTAIQDMLKIEAGGILSIGTHQLTSDTLFTYSGLTVADNARFRLARTTGFYDGTSNAAISNAGNMNFFLGANSIVEYNTATYARVTGINVGIATLPQHKYGILEINHVGPAGTWVAPTYLPTFTTAVYIRTRLIMTAGECNLSDASGNPVNGGRYVHIENPSPTAMQRTGGFIRSEALDHSARIVWTINATTGTYLLPWGYSSTQYIPLTYQMTGGTAGIVSFSTYRTPANNLPWPPGVTNLTSHIGLTPDNRTATVDRFWRMANTGSNPVVNLTFNYISTELPGIPYNSAGLIRAHAYNTPTNTWMAALPGQTAVAYQVSVPAAGGQPHWALASLNAALPVDWLFFDGKKLGGVVQLDWATAEEKDNSHFIVERTRDFIEVQQLGIVTGIGTSSATSSYDYIDENPFAGENYYRLRQVDINGVEELTGWIAVNFNNKLKNVVSLWPNPVEDQVYFTGLEEDMQWVIYDFTGKQIWQGILSVDGPSLSMENLSLGIYTLVLTDHQNKQQSLRFVKAR